MTDEDFYVEYYSGNQGSKQFFAGQQIQARVVLRLSKPMKARDISVHVSGKAESHWTETRRTTSRSGGCHRHGSRSTTHTETVHYHSEEVYLDHRQLLWAPPNELIPAGLHQFPFAFTVPAYAPPSFEGSYGNIRYTSNVNIDRPWWFDKKISSSFDLAALVDLNSIQRALPPVGHYMQKTIGCCFFKHGKIGVKVRLPQSGFVPGEKVQIDVEVDNRTTTEVQKVSARLMQETTFFAQGHTRSKSLIMAASSSITNKLSAKSKGSFQRHLVVPPCEPSLSTQPIKIDYTLEVKIRTNACFCSSCSVKIPLFIGTIPIRQQQNINMNLPPAPGFCVRI